jgi:hypothetical protein
MLLAALLAAAPAPVAVPATAPSAAVVLQAFDAAIPYRPAPVRIGDTRHLIYELHLTNFASAPLTVDRIAVHDAATGAELLALSGDALAAALGHLPSGGGTKGPTIAPGIRAIAYLDLALQDGATPVTLTHSVAVAGASGAATIDAGRVAVDDRPLPVLGPPLRGGPWVAIYAPEMERGHRRVPYATAGKATIPGRFAIDFMKIDTAGRFDRTDGKALADSLSHGAEVLAVADAVVAATRDDFTEPKLRADLPRVSIGDATGNFVALDLGDGRYAFYEHLQPGIKVKSGDRVKRGQVIGRLGLTGQGSAPHLHFHVASAPSPLAAEGLPFLLEGVQTIGGYPAIGDLGKGPWRPAPKVEGPSLPAANSVVRFPD